MLNGSNRRHCGHSLWPLCSVLKVDAVGLEVRVPVPAAVVDADGARASRCLSIILVKPKSTVVWMGCAGNTGTGAGLVVATIINADGAGVASASSRRSRQHRWCRAGGGGDGRSSSILGVVMVK